MFYLDKNLEILQQDGDCSIREQYASATIEVGVADYQNGGYIAEENASEEYVSWAMSENVSELEDAFDLMESLDEKHFKSEQDYHIANSILEDMNDNNQEPNEAFMEMFLNSLSIEVIQ